MADVYRGDLTPLQRHVAFFDRNKDGVIYPSETYQGTHGSFTSRTVLSKTRTCQLRNSARDDNINCFRVPSDRGRRPARRRRCRLHQRPPWTQDYTGICRAPFFASFLYLLPALCIFSLSTLLAGPQISTIMAKCVVVS
jgi:hypothetical protein